MRPHWWDVAIRAASINTHTVTLDPESVHFLNDWMISSNRVTIWPHFQPFPAAIVSRVFGSSISIHSITVPRKMKLFYFLKDIHFYLQATYNYSRSVTPAESMTTIA